MRKLVALILAAVMGVTMLFPANVGAIGVDDCQRSFLTFRPWYYGVMKVEGDKCVSAGPAEEGGLGAFVWKIVLNVLYDMFSLIGYLAVGFLIYGGYMYMLARGQAARAEKGKKIVINSIIGLVIALLSSFVVALISNALIEGGA
jgi:hypothetical protein